MNSFHLKRKTYYFIAMLATYINAAAIILGTIIGLLFRKVISDRIKLIVFQASGLATMFMGILMIMKSKETVLSVFAIILGGMVGELLRLEQGLEKTGKWLKSKMSRKEDNPHFTEGFVNASTTFCIGAMAILGSINASAGSYEIILTKSIMDGSISVIFAAVMGFGVGFSAFSVLIYQGAITLLASKLVFIKNIMYLNEISAVGGILILGIGFNLLDIKRIRVANFIPAIFFIILLIYIKLTYFA